MINVDKTNSAEATYRSGAAARLAGVQVETLRVWERRYGITDPKRSQHGQRNYSFEEVRRLGLIKQLVDLGNPIGAIARLPLEQLTALLNTANTLSLTDAQRAPKNIRVAVIGAALTQRMLRPDQLSPTLEVVASCATLSVAMTRLNDIKADILLIESLEMTEPSLLNINQVKEHIKARTVIVLYRFCSSDTIRQLREAGHVAARSPADTIEIEFICRSALTAAERPIRKHTAQQNQKITNKYVVPARRFDENTLDAISLAASNVQCECPRHLVDLLLMLNSFERYSEQCESRELVDAALHSDLHASAAQARVLLEQTLERLAQAEGLPLPSL